MREMGGFACGTLELRSEAVAAMLCDLRFEQARKPDDIGRRAQSRGEGLRGARLRCRDVGRVFKSAC